MFKNKKLLNEVTENAEERIKNAINNVLRVQMTYNDGKLPKKGRNRRYILPVAFGLTKSGKKAVRAFQTTGSTKRGTPKWKLFLLDNIVSWVNGEKSFKQYKDDLIRLGLNTHGDKHMTTLYAITPFADADVQVSKYNNTITPEPVTKDEINPTINNQKPQNKQNTKFVPSVNKQTATIDNKDKNDYYQNKTNTLNTQQINQIDNTTDNNIINKTNINNGNIQPVDNNPISKSDIENNIETNKIEDDNLENNELTKKYNDLMNRMDNLYYDNNEKNEDI